jgi:hypothetical protein
MELAVLGILGLPFLGVDLGVGLFGGCGMRSSGGKDFASLHQKPPEDRIPHSHMDPTFRGATHTHFGQWDFD